MNAQFQAIGDELIKSGNPTAVYSTKVTKTAKDRPTDGEPEVPGGLTPIPEDHWLQATEGEVLLGLFRDEKNRDVVAFASHNAYQPQDVTVRFGSRVNKVSLFHRTARTWKRLKVTRNQTSFKVAVSATELLRIER